MGKSYGSLNKTPHLKNKEIYLKEMRRYRFYHTNSKHYFRCKEERIESDCHCFNCVKTSK